jgi:hypothetical protein
MNLICWYFGCEQHPQDPSPPEVAYCWRCNRYVDYGDTVGDTRHNRFKSWLKGLWPRKCQDCGHRFKCDESVDHIPF